MQTMTALAEMCVQLAQACLTRALQAQFGSPSGEAGATAQELLVIAMGKLGGTPSKTRRRPSLLPDRPGAS